MHHIVVFITVSFFVQKKIINGRIAGGDVLESVSF